MDIHEIMEKFSGLSNAVIGHGPKHPISPRADIANIVSKFISKNTFLRSDPGYIEYLEFYSAAFIERPEEGLIVDVFGFLDISSHITEQDGLVIDEDGNYVFSSVLLGGSKEFNYLFSSKKYYHPGVYKAFLENDGRIQVSWHCKSFKDWLGMVVERNGYID